MGSTSSMLYEIAYIAYSPTPEVAVASFLNLKKVDGITPPVVAPFILKTTALGGGRRTCEGRPPPEDSATSAASGTLELLGARGVREFDLGGDQISSADTGAASRRLLVALVW